MKKVLALSLATGVFATNLVADSNIESSTLKTGRGIWRELLVTQDIDLNRTFDDTFSGTLQTLDTPESIIDKAQPNFDYPHAITYEDAYDVAKTLNSMLLGRF